MAVGIGTLIKINPNSTSDTTSDAALVLQHFSVTLESITYEDDSRVFIFFAPAFELSVHGATAVTLYYFNGTGGGNSTSDWTQVTLTGSGEDYHYYHNTSNATAYNDIHIWKVVFKRYRISLFNWSYITFLLFGANGVQWKWRKNWTGEPVRAMSVNWWRIDSSGTYTYTDCASCIAQQSPLVQKGKLITWNKQTIVDRAPGWELESGSDRVTLCTHQAMDYVTQVGGVDSAVWLDETPETEQDEGGSGGGGSEHTHTYVTDPALSVAATCESPGVTVKKCTCGAETRTTVAALGHNWTAWIYDPATGDDVHLCRRCQKFGHRTHVHTYNAYGVCTGCNATRPGSGGGGCFDGDTPIILTSYTTVLLKEILTGMKLLGYNLETEQFEPTTVLKLNIYTTQENMFKIYFDNGTMALCTSEHPFLTDKGWVSCNPLLSLRNHKVECQLMQIGLRVLSIDKTYCTITAIDPFEHGIEHTVYDITTTPIHTFLANGLVVHNTKANN